MQRRFLRKRGAAGQDKPSQSRLMSCQLPRRGSFISADRQMPKSSPFGGAGIEQSEMTERVPHGEKANRENPRLRSNEISGGRNREELLGQRPARRKCRLRHDADAGSRNPISEDHSKSYFFSVATFHNIKLQPICDLVLQLGSISCIIFPARKCKLIANC